MIRDSLAANSKHFSIFMTGNGNGINPYCEFRTENGEDSTDNYSGQTISNRTNIRLKIVKTGNVLRAYYKRTQAGRLGHDLCHSRQQQSSNNR